MKARWYIRKDKTHVLKYGKWKVLEIFKRYGSFWSCFVFDKGKIVYSEGYHSSFFPKRYHAVRWGCKKARELKIIK